MAAQIKDAAWLEWMASMMGATPSRDTAPSPLPPDRFHCLLDGLPLHLVPQRQLALFNANVTGQNFIFNPECSLIAASEVPDALKGHEELLDSFCLRGNIAWVRDPNSGVLNPFWLGRDLTDAISRIRAGKAIDIPSSLIGARIFIPPEYAVHERAQWTRTAEAGSRLFQQKQYLPLRRLIHPFLVAALRRYYRHQIRRGAIRLGDDQSSRRYIAHNEPVARFFHDQLASLVSAIAGQPVKPSYVYLASYLGGAELKKHTDREQCEFSITLCLDFSPEPDLATMWPIRLETPQGTVAIYQALGDGLLYRGTKVPHFREPLGEGFTSTSIFFHYVAQDFTGTLN